MPKLVVHVDFPALDRFVDFLNAAQQKEIDAATAALKAVTSQMQQSRQALEAIIQKGEQ